MNRNLLGIFMAIRKSVLVLVFLGILSSGFEARAVYLLGYTQSDGKLGQIPLKGESLDPQVDLAYRVIHHYSWPMVKGKFTPGWEKSDPELKGLLAEEPAAEESFL